MEGGEKLGKEFVVNSPEELCELMCPAPAVGRYWYDGDFGMWQLEDSNGEWIGSTKTLEELYDLAAEFGLEIKEDK